MSMDILTEEGKQVVYMGPAGGEEHDQANASKYLEIGKTYTIRKKRVWWWRTNIWLEEVSDDVFFNSVQFNNKGV